MSYTSGGLSILVLIIAALLIKPRPTGYNDNFLELRNIVYILGSLSALFVYALNLKLFNDKENPVFRILSYIIFVSTTVSCIFSLATVTAKHSLTTLSLSTINIIEIANLISSWIFLVYGFYVLSIIQIENGKLPQYGRIVGILNGVVSIINTIGISFGLLSPTIFIPLVIIGTMILHPVFMVALAQTYKKSVTNVST